jgi:hypothetical protein
LAWSGKTSALNVRYEVFMRLARAAMLKLNRSTCFLASILSALSLLAPLRPLSAQVLYGSITGTVTDATGAAVAGVQVEALDTATGIVKQVATDEHGGYLITNLQAGAYTISFTAPLFGKVVQQGVSIDANTETRADARLQLASVNQSVTVDASLTTLQADRADVNSQIRTSQLANLPITGQRNFQSLFKLVPGFSPPAASHSEAGNPQGALATNVNGASYNNNNTRLDGASDTYPWLPEIVAYIPPAEAIQTVNIVTNSFDAEQGLAGGSVVNVAIKSGTNQFHGSA